MKKRLDNSTKENIIKTTIALIDDNGGATNVNLREVARQAGCSAPNIYNYFISLDDLLNNVLVEICEDFKRGLEERVAENSEDVLVLAFEFYIQYALEYPGRLNLYHFEKLNMKINSFATQSAASVGQAMAGILANGTEDISKEKVQQICHLIHCYLLGELSEYITGRSLIENKDEYAKDLVACCSHLYLIFMQNL